MAAPARSGLEGVWGLLMEEAEPQEVCMGWGFAWDGVELPELPGSLFPGAFWAGWGSVPLAPVLGEFGDGGSDPREHLPSAWVLRCGSVALPGSGWH